MGAPYEDGGGVVYIYRGSATGLVVTPSQIISASDMGGNLRGFGSAISRGTDVDNNGYIGKEGSLIDAKRNCSGFG